MTTPFYKKRPQWWIKLLDIFHITEKQYWTIFFAYLAILIISLLVEKFILQRFSINNVDIYKLFWYSLPTAPFGYYWILHNLKKLPNDWFRAHLIQSEPYRIIGAIFSPIITLVVLVKHYFAR